MTISQVHCCFVLSDVTTMLSRDTTPNTHSQTKVKGFLTANPNYMELRKAAHQTAQKHDSTKVMLCDVLFLLQASVMPPTPLVMLRLICSASYSQE